MQSAEELIRVLCPEYMGDEDAAALIRARDREIVEACEQATAQWNLRGQAGGILTLLDAFNSILRTD